MCAFRCLSNCHGSTVSLLPSIKRYFVLLSDCLDLRKFLDIEFLPLSHLGLDPYPSFSVWFDKINKINHYYGAEVGSGSDLDLDPCFGDNSCWHMVWHNSCFPNARTSVENLWKVSVLIHPRNLGLYSDAWWFSSRHNSRYLLSSCKYEPKRENNDQILWWSLRWSSLSDSDWAPAGDAKYPVIYFKLN